MTNVFQTALYILAPFGLAALCLLVYFIVDINKSTTQEPESGQYGAVACDPTVPYHIWNGFLEQEMATGLAQLVDGKVTPVVNNPQTILKRLRKYEAVQKRRQERLATLAVLYAKNATATA